ncbi:MAG TPA: type 1 glutamine amidotransferase [Verrucomicrobiota bacterium]|jgi:GMP synthase (glutamine-hydrolysing)|nr:type 1 glutamine amidotransferase [Verrucomicrobiota bacterium]
MVDTTALRILIIDGYTKAAREQLQSGGASLAADLYVKMLQRCAPTGVECDVIFPADSGVSLPVGETIQDYDGVAWTGCSSCVFSGEPDVAEQIEFARECYRRGVPAFGSCWAAQIAVVAAGGEVALNPNGREMGIARGITLTDEGRAHPLYEGKPAVFDAFTSHDDEVTVLPEGATRLSGNDFTRVQSVVVKHEGTEFWGLQYHPEYDLHEMARLMFCRIEKLVRLGFFADEAAGLAHIDQLEALHADPTREDIATALGLKADVMDDSLRTIEVQNWINHHLLPSKRR